MMVSVIIPTYNRADKLKRCLRSLVQQTNKDFEVIVCDDGSTDNTREIVYEFAALLNLTYDHNSNFGGPSRPRNSGLQLARGQYIAFLDSDDWWYPEKIEVSIRNLKNHDIVYHDLDKYFDEKGPKGKIKGRVLRENVFSDLVIQTDGIPNSSVVIRRAIVEKVGRFSEDRNLIAVEDADYWIRVATITSRFKYIPTTLGAYWIGENISDSEKQVTRQTHLLFKYIDQLLPNEQVKAKKLLAFNSARIYHNLFMFTEAIAHYKVSIGIHNISVNIKALVGIAACKFKIVV